ncbi:hypothetical protein TL16_g01397 [Triparma laevis f. inornata]|uniref:Ubiquitin-like protease family profile domain-containing protein n=1 Tax=Triparma laevis f. inornata TaxID=1714386 RepID=A0A9W6ZJF5_9STRA|nr:hypothetical protein TL16_g01397 [Triparma laevis f. inornata]
MSSSQSSQMFSIYVPTAAAPVMMFTPTSLDPTSSSSLPSASAASSSIPSDAHSPILSQTTMMLTAMPTMIPKPGLGLRLRNSPYPSHPGVYVKMPDWNVPLKAWLTFSAMIDAMNPENEDDKIKVERSVKKEVFSPDLITKLTGSDGKRQRNVVDKFQRVKNVDAFNVYVHDVYNGEEGGGGKEGENEVIDLSIDLGWGVAYVPDVGDRINLDVNNIRGEAVCRIENEIQRKGKRRKTQISVKEADRCRVNLKGCYLNDTVVNFYGRYISSSNPDTTSSENVYVFPTYFYTKIEGVKGSEQALADLWSDIGFWIPTNLWTLKFVIFPVNYGLHWSTACIVNPGAVFAEDGSLGQPAIIHLDSGKKLKAHSSGDIYKVIRLFLASALIAMNKEEEQELDAEDGDIEKNKEVGEKRKGFVKLTSKNAKKHFTAEKLPGISPANEGKGMPQQSNEDDCGVYLLKSIKALKELADGGFELEKRHVEEKFLKVGKWAQKDIDDFREEVGRIFYDVGVEGRREESLKRQES